MTNLYITPIEYQRAPTGQETTSLVNNLTRLSSSISAGATSIPLLQTITAALDQYDQLTIFDGGNSEVVTVGSGGAAIGSASISVAATQFAHNAGTVVCGDGQLGSLAEVISFASAALESYCQQALLQATYTETLDLRSLSASITNDGQLLIRPRHFPVTTISALSLETDISTIITLDSTQAIIETRQRMIKVPIISQLGQSNTTIITQPPLDQTQPGFVNLTYTAGFAYSSLPWDIKQACVLLTSNTLSDRLNPSGAADVQMGHRKVVAYLRGDLSAESALYKRATALLDPYRRQQ